MDLIRIKNLFNGYYQLIKSPAGSDGDRARLAIEADIRNLVLTGDDILQLELIKLTDKDIQNNPLYEKLVQDYGRLEELLSRQRKKRFEDNRNDYVVKLGEIESLVGGKQGSFVDRIRNILES